jgi:hypothetical protein
MCAYMSTSSLCFHFLALRASELSYFAIIDFTERKKGTAEYFPCLLTAMQNHGMMLPRNADAVALARNSVILTSDDGTLGAVSSEQNTTRAARCSIACC